MLPMNWVQEHILLPLMINNKKCLTIHFIKEHNNEQYN